MRRPLGWAGAGGSHRLRVQRSHGRGHDRGLGNHDGRGLRSNGQGIGLQQGGGVLAGGGAEAAAASAVPCSGQRAAASVASWTAAVAERASELTQAPADTHAVTPESTIYCKPTASAVKSPLGGEVKEANTNNATGGK
jgi:hypothetical protein